MMVSHALRFAIASLVASTALIHASNVQGQDSAASRMRPLGSPSAVDQYQSRMQNAMPSQVRHTAAMQQTSAVGAGPVPTTAPPTPPAAGAPALPTPGPIVGDATPMQAPALAGGFATIDNCHLVTPASGYVASYGDGCAPETIPNITAGSPLAYSIPPAQIAAPAAIPTVTQGLRFMPVPLISFGQERNPVQVGQGLLGQPKAYVPGQPLRNGIRYFFP